MERVGFVNLLELNLKSEKKLTVGPFFVSLLHTDSRIFSHPQRIVTPQQSGGEQPNRRNAFFALEFRLKNHFDADVETLCEFLMSYGSASHQNHLQSLLTQVRSEILSGRHPPTRIRYMVSPFFGRLVKESFAIHIQRFWRGFWVRSCLSVFRVRVVKVRRVRSE